MPRWRSQGVLLAEMDEAYPDLVRWFRRARDLVVGDVFAHFKDLNRKLHALACLADLPARAKNEGF